MALDYMDGAVCLGWCSQYSLATGCEYNMDNRTCKAHTWSVSSASGHKGFLCSVILPKGMFLISFKRITFIIIFNSTIEVCLEH